MVGRHRPSRISRKATLSIDELSIFLGSCVCRTGEPSLYQNKKQEKLGKGRHLEI